MIKDPGAGLYPGESHAVLASGGCDLLPLFPAVFPAATANGMGLKRWKTCYKVCNYSVCSCDYWYKADPVLLLCGDGITLKSVIMTWIMCSSGRSLPSKPSFL